MASLHTIADSNIRKTWTLMITFFFVVIGIGLALSYVTNNPVILFVAVLFSVGMNAGGYWFSDTIALKAAGAQLADGTEFLELNRIVENLAITAGVPKPKVYVIADPAPNAFATGRDPAHAAVAVTTGLLSIMQKSELEGVISHELSHVKNRDTLVMTVVVVLLGFVTLLSDFFIRSQMWGGGSGEKNNQMRMIMIVVGFALAIFAPIIARLIQLAISRKREFLADASGALLTRYPEGLASALKKIGEYPNPMKRANNATAHLFIGNPFGKVGSSGFSKLFMTHPPIEERVRALLGQ